MMTSTEQKQNGIQWTLWKVEDLDFSDELALLSHQQQMQKKTNMAKNSARLGLTINRENSKGFRTNISNNTPITV
ncbi:hypothetical protein DPMN_106801 [Dreissena polymorpha]|uniref:Uncharacterized protein n=1 Tax=Dreissena polymorpha TaxID=45954 RepID=A0A9D4QK64_DREPO|nr:hypothetical protein DPMN_106801 [Dreissena polymorpha]